MSISPWQKSWTRDIKDVRDMTWALAWLVLPMKTHASLAGASVRDPSKGSRCISGPIVSGYKEQPEHMKDQCGTPLPSLCEAAHFTGLPEHYRHIQSIIPLICPHPPLNTFLYHYDISENNVFVDDSGAPVALLDWEQLNATHPVKMDTHPVIIATEYKPGNYHVLNYKPWTEIGPKTKSEYDFELIIQDIELQKVFKKRLERLHSPYLQALKKRDDDLGELFDCLEEISRSYIGHAAHLFEVVREE
ncbi:hypothetical protein M501DRAFT_1017307 [Patellaria atrata CBS 101060]|uniref:Aminoglycoside phosphotransferase domain-containing protein n=1 Tax=Patellaria atrata CBS 101060 TaxID=1346257 RepID=A0A9P4VP09_9PEZI|nr:hypothetical protein M501DRAFT_1017307 [Patellaria atrata CBS 101060]